MLDQFGRNIDYMRISITEMCNLNCKYCMPSKKNNTAQEKALNYEEILRICNITSHLGIDKIRITGGEPLTRSGCFSFIKALRKLPLINTISLTTNGVLLNNYLDDICSSGINSINISVNTLKSSSYSEITGRNIFFTLNYDEVIDKLIKNGIKVKLNSVILESTMDEWEDIIAFADSKKIDVRFIELMPIGEGKRYMKIHSESVINTLRKKYPTLKTIRERRGSGPAQYYETDGLNCKIGVISAISHRFCATCNRVRLTSGGELKTCLAFRDGISIKKLIDEGKKDEEIEQIIEKTIFNKIKEHNFFVGNITENRRMHQIGG